MIAAEPVAEEAVEEAADEPAGEKVRCDDDAVVADGEEESVEDEYADAEKSGS